MASYDTIWYTRCPVPTATGIAADLGWLADEFAPDGVEVRSLQDIPREEASDFHFTHAHPGLFREGGNVPALWARSRGEETRLIGLTWIEERQVIQVRADSAITVPEQLKGARLAIPRHEISIDFWRAMALHGFDGALGLAGLGLADAELVEVPAGPSSGIRPAGHPGSGRPNSPRWPGARWTRSTPRAPSPLRPLRGTGRWSASSWTPRPASAPGSTTGRRARSRCISDCSTSGPSWPSAS